MHHTHTYGLLGSYMVAFKWSFGIIIVINIMPVFWVFYDEGLLWNLLQLDTVENTLVCFAINNKPRDVMTPTTYVMVVSSLQYDL